MLVSGTAIAQQKGVSLGGTHSNLDLFKVFFTWDGAGDLTVANSANFTANQVVATSSASTFAAPNLADGQFLIRSGSNTGLFPGSSNSTLNVDAAGTVVARFSNVGGGTLSIVTILALNSLLFSTTTPTISSGFGVGASVVAANGTGAFQINVGTGGTASSGVIGLPTAATGWVCKCDDITTQSATVTRTTQTASSTSSCTVVNYSDITVLSAWVASDKLNCAATAY